MGFFNKIKEKILKKESKKESGSEKTTSDEDASSLKDNLDTESVSTKTSNNKKNPTNIYYLTMRMENNKKVGWEIKRGNAAKVSAIVPTKEQAKEKVKILAKNSKASVIVYRQDGSVEETYKINA